jgi:hypothetical protein
MWLIARRVATTDIQGSTQLVSQVWSVGYYNARGEWYEHEFFKNRVDAESVCHYLNGGN